MSEPSPVTHRDLDQPHAFFTRQGGVSRGVYASQNAGLGSGDDSEHVRKNRERMATHLGVEPERLVTPFQVHSARAVTVDGPWAEERPRADAVVTNVPQLAVGIVTADCGPVLFADARAGVVGAAHAGWKGALTGITDATIETMEALGARRADIRATLGPTIARESYEVDDAFRDRFLAVSADNAVFFTPGKRAGHPMFDLPAYLLARLRRAGVEAEWTGHDTYTLEADFYSYRRTTHRGEPDYGRQLSAIVLR